MSFEIGDNDFGGIVFSLFRFQTYFCLEIIFCSLSTFYNASTQFLIINKYKSRYSTMKEQNKTFIFYYITITKNVMFMTMNHFF